MRNLRLIDQSAVAYAVSLLNVEHRRGDGSPISQIDTIVGRINRVSSGLGAFCCANDLLP